VPIFFCNDAKTQSAFSCSYSSAIAGTLGVFPRSAGCLKPQSFAAKVRKNVQAISHFAAHLGALPQTHKIAWLSLTPRVGACLIISK